MGIWEEISKGWGLPAPAATATPTPTATPAVSVPHPVTPPGTPGATPASLGMIPTADGQNWTNPVGAGLDASGALLPGYKYATYSNGVGQGTPQQIGDVGLLGQTVTGNAPPPAGSYNPNITAGPQTYARPGGMTGNTKPAPVGQPLGQSNILQRLAQALQAQRGLSTAGARTTPTTGNPYYSQLAQMLTQRFGGNGITSAGQNGLLKNNSLYSNYLK